MKPESTGNFLDVETREDVLIARFAHEVNLFGHTAEAVAEQLRSLLSDTSRQRLLVDFGKVNSLSSFMLGQLMKLNKTAEAAGRRLTLFNLRPQVREILKVTGLNLILALYEDESDALRGS